ncbi:MAG: hypothetical protein WBV94_10070 [Blastocatellia bacterium]
MMNRQRIYRAVVCFLTLAVSAKVANAQSKDRDNPTLLASSIISGLVDSESRGNYYFYSFMANPGEVSITLTVEPGRKANDSDFISFTGVSFSLYYDRNAAELAGKEVSTANDTGSRQAVARVEITRRQLLVLGIHVPDKSSYNSVGGKYRVRIEGTVDIGSNKSSKNTSSSGLSQADIDATLSSKPVECLPKRGTLIIKIKDGSKKIIDLSEAETVTVVPEK